MAAEKEAPKPEKVLSSFLEAIDNEKSADLKDTNELLASLPPKKLAAHGLAVLNLTIGSTRTGFAGKTIVDLEPDESIAKENAKIESGNVRVGDIVKVQPAKSKPNDATGFEAVVVKVWNRVISVSVEEKFESSTDIDGRVWLVKLTNDVTYKRMQYAMKDMEKLQENEMTILQRILLGKENPQFREDEGIEIMDTTLNEPQVKAVKFALGSDVSIIHGPPGTGKTYTLVEIIRQLVAKGERVLVCGPSNISVDNILERLHEHIDGNKLVRMGHPARLLQANLIHSLDIVSKTSNEGQVLKGIRDEIDSILKKVKRGKGSSKKKLWADLKDLRKDYKVREKGVLRSIISEARVVVATLHGAGSGDIKEARDLIPDLFSTIIIDEVSQSLEPQCWIPITCCPSAKRLIIAGDSLQLPPTVKTKQDKYRRTLERTLFDRLEKLYGTKAKRLLSIQYRMNEKIMEFSSRSLYDGQLRAAESVAKRRLCDLKGVEETFETMHPVIWQDTQTAEFSESEDEKGISFSKFNLNEAWLVIAHIEKLLEAGCKETDIGVITPYSAQVSLISGHLLEKYPAIEVSTVDGFQGREKNAVIMSLVRSNEAREVGFLAEKRRLNVAMTRPKMHLCVIGDMQTISSDKFMRDWADWAEENAELSYPTIDDIIVDE